MPGQGHEGGRRLGEERWNRPLRPSSEESSRTLKSCLKEFVSFQLRGLRQTFLGEAPRSF
jgi:hypothetical protein